MNVLLVDQFSELGGGQLCLIEMVAELRQAGHDCTVSAPGNGPLVQRLPGVEKYLPLPERTYTSGRKTILDVMGYVWHSIRVIWLLRKYLRTHDCDLVYANGPRAFLWASEATRFTRVETLWHLHFILSGWKEKLLLRALRRPKLLFAVSDAAKKSLPTSLQDVVRVVYNGLPVVIPQLEKNARRKIGIVGRIHPTKGQLVGLQAFHQLAERGLTAELHIVGSPMFGDVEAEEYFHTMQQFIQEKKLEEQVIFHGQVAHADAMMPAFTVLIQPSPTPDPLPRTVLEAMRYGVVVLGSKVGGIPEMIRDEEGGLLHEPGDVETLATQLATLLTDDDLLARMSVAAVQRSQQFSADAYFQTVHKYLRNI